MDTDSKKTALRMIPYGLYILTAEDEDGRISAGTVNWVTQASFKPPLLVVAVKADSLIHSVIKRSGAFALNILGKDQQSQAFAFFKPAERDGQTIGGEAFRSGITGSPLIERARAFLECRVLETVEKGDHSVFVGEVVDAGISHVPQARPDQATLWLMDLGEKVFYGG